MEREEAEDLIKRHGGRVTSAVSKKTVDDTMWIFYCLLSFLMLQSYNQLEFSVELSFSWWGYWWEEIFKSKRARVSHTTFIETLALIIDSSITKTFDFDSIPFLNEDGLFEMIRKSRPAEEKKTLEKMNKQKKNSSPHKVEVKSTFLYLAPFVASDFYSCFVT